jgi:hypothetical protein
VAEKISDEIVSKAGGDRRLMSEVLQ